MQFVMLLLGARLGWHARHGRVRRASSLAPGVVVAGRRGRRAETDARIHDQRSSRAADRAGAGAARPPADHSDSRRDLRGPEHPRKSGSRRSGLANRSRRRIRRARHALHAADRRRPIDLYPERGHPARSAGYTKKLLAGEPVDPSQVYFKTVPTFETSAPELQWLTRSIFIGTGERHPAEVVIRVWKVD